MRAEDVLLVKQYSIGRIVSTRVSLVASLPSQALLIKP